MNQQPVPSFDDPGVAGRFLDRYESLRGRVRTAVVRRHLEAVAGLGQPRRVVDVGCGDGRELLWLAAAGHEAHGYDPAVEMLDRARETADARSPDHNIRFRHGGADQARSDHGPGTFDLVLSHGVLLYQPDPDAFLADHVRLARLGGFISVVTRNADALAFRAARERGPAEARRLLDDRQSVNHLGLPTAAHDVQELSGLLAALGAPVVSWSGIRVFTDDPRPETDPAEEQQWIDLEWAAARRDPYRRTAALLHLIAQRTR